MDAKAVEQAILAEVRDKTGDSYINEDNMWYEDSAHWVFEEPVEVRADVVTIQVIDSEEGGEDVFPASGGEIWHLVKVTTAAGEQFFKKTGYQSHMGTDWNGEFKEVFPTQKTITIYE